ncbi:hypothetical protein JCM21900_001534 [Sporobolomyces salmonicolor]
MPPPKLDYATSTYLTLTTTASPSSVLSAAAQEPPASSPAPSQFAPHSTSSPPSSTPASASSASLLHSLAYVGPVGALAHEHLYALPGVPSADPPARAVVAVQAWLARQPGVRGVEVLVPKPRTKRRVES